MFENINYIELLVAGVASMVVGYAWYGPLFGKAWMKESGVTQAKIDAGKKEMPKTYGMMFVGSVITAYVLSVFIGLAGATDYMSAATVAFWAWLGFVATVMLGNVLFEGRSWNYLGINAGYNLVNMVVMSAVLVML